jgi:hypothetical protein
MAQSLTRDTDRLGFGCSYRIRPPLGYRRSVLTMQSLTKTGSALRGPSSTSAPRLITPDEAVGRVRVLLANEHVDFRQRLLSIAGIAIAAVITLDEDAVDVAEIDGLQECVNRALFTYTPITG